MSKANTHYNCACQYSFWLKKIILENCTEIEVCFYMKNFTIGKICSSITYIIHD